MTRWPSWARSSDWQALMPRWAPPSSPMITPSRTTSSQHVACKRGRAGVHGGHLADDRVHHELADPGGDRRQHARRHGDPGEQDAQPVIGGPDEIHRAARVLEHAGVAGEFLEPAAGGRRRADGALRVGGKLRQGRRHACYQLKKLAAKSRRKMVLAARQFDEAVGAAQRDEVAGRVGRFRMGRDLAIVAPGERHRQKISEVGLELHVAPSRTRATGRGEAPIAASSPGTT